MIVLGASFLVKLIFKEKGSEKTRDLTRSWAKNGETQATIDLGCVANRIN